jgi:hypothetical protein
VEDPSQTAGQLAGEEYGSNQAKIGSLFGFHFHLPFFIQRCGGDGRFLLSSLYKVGVKPGMEGCKKGVKLILGSVLIDGEWRMPAPGCSAFPVSFAVVLFCPQAI